MRGLAYCGVSGAKFCDRKPEMLLAGGFMVQDLWHGGGPRIFVVARTCTCVYFDCAGFCCRGLVQIQESATEMAEGGQKRRAGAEAEDRAIECFLVELPEPSLVQDTPQPPPQKVLRREDQAWPVRARVACLRVHCRACQCLKI